MIEEKKKPAINIEYATERVREMLGTPKRVGETSKYPVQHHPIDHRVDPDDLRLPGLVSEDEWALAEKLTAQTELDIFGEKLSPLNKALLFRIIYIELLQMQLKPN